MGSELTGWVLVEAVGDRELVGRVSEAEIAGGFMLRIDVPSTADCDAFRVYFHLDAIMVITPITEESARELLEGNRWVPAVYGLDDDSQFSCYPWSNDNDLPA